MYDLANSEGMQDFSPTCSEAECGVSDGIVKGVL
ncbi:hypothetical protein Barb6XT_00982 [Bacteroidales bacterium Barb6XT]|nr:hypothetical protein Barb6XT_00982 [Bacteroidales bacterium Barb6XT]